MRRRRLGVNDIASDVESLTSGPILVSIGARRAEPSWPALFGLGSPVLPGSRSLAASQVRVEPDVLPFVRCSDSRYGRSWWATLWALGALSFSACGSGGSDPGSANTDTDTDATAANEHDSTSAPADTPGNLPNLSTHSQDLPDQNPAPEPADCDVLTLAPCVTQALDELSNCLAAGHGGTFAAETSRCDLPEAGAVVTFSQAVPRWSTAFALNFVLEVGGQSCARYSEQPDEHGFAAGIELIAGQHTVTFATAEDQQSTLTCDGVSVGYRQSNLAQCHDSKAAPSPELVDQTLDGLYQVSPRQQSNRRIFNCRFPANGP